MTPMSEERLREIEAREQAATKGPWEMGGPYPSVTVIVMVDGGSGWPDPDPPIYEAVAYLHDGVVSDYKEPPPEQAVADSAFIANARQDVPELVAALRHFTTLPPEVAAAMERYARHIESENCAASSPYFDAHGFDDLQRLTDVLAIAAHFTKLFQKGN